MATNNLNELIASKVAAASSRPAEPQNGDLLKVSVTLLDDNPFQPRTSMDATELDELVTSLRAQGLIQPIAIRPKPDGRYIIVAGHRRVAAFRKLLESGSPAEQAAFATISAQLKLALDDAQLAAQAYIENVTRSALTPLEEAMACQRMMEKGLAKSPEELANLLSQPVRRINRLRKLLQAPPIVQQAVSSGLQVVIQKNADGSETKELRRLDLHAALSFQRLFEHFLKTKSPKVSSGRTEKAVRRALGGNWGFQRIDGFVTDVIAGKARVEDGPDEAAAPTPVEAALFVHTAKRFSFDPTRLAAASDAQLADLQAAFDGLLKAARAPQETAATNVGEVWAET